MHRHIEEYMNTICKKVNVPHKDNGQKTKKISNDMVVIPTTDSIDILSEYNYNLQQLKTFVKHYKLKQSGNKNELFLRIYNYLMLSKEIIVIQKVFRGYLLRSYEKCQGPAYRKRGICVNETDFLTMDSVSDIPNNQFYSFKDSDGFIYGFDILSLFNLNKKGFYHRDGIKNPYNRSKIPTCVINNMKKLIRLSRLVNRHINITIEEEVQDVVERDFNTRCRDLFHTIDTTTGNYTSSEWFMGLSVRRLRGLVRELTEIWNYRANIPHQVRRQICPPDGNPFRNLRYADIFAVSDDSFNEDHKKMILSVLEKLVYSGTNDSNKGLGAYYVLGALTLVNSSAASALPWLYESFAYV